MSTDRLKIWHQGDRFIVEVAKEFASQFEGDLRTRQIGHSIAASQDRIVIFEFFRGDQKRIKTLLSTYEHNDPGL